MWYFTDEVEDPFAERTYICNLDWVVSRLGFVRLRLTIPRQPLYHSSPLFVRLWFHMWRLFCPYLFLILSFSLCLRQFFGIVAHPGYIQLYFFVQMRAKVSISIQTHRPIAYIILTPLTPLLYTKTGVYRGMHYCSFARKHRLWYSLEPPRRGGSNEYPQSVFWAETWKISEIFIWEFSVFRGEIVYIFE